MVIGGCILNIMKEFLTNRKQILCVDGQYSDLRNIISGVPQGSVLGPLLYIIYTSDMWHGLGNKLVAYVDDATLMSVVPFNTDWASVANSLKRDLTRIFET